VQVVQGVSERGEYYLKIVRPCLRHRPSSRDLKCTLSASLCRYYRTPQGDSNQLVVVYLTVLLEPMAPRSAFRSLQQHTFVFFNGGEPVAPVHGDRRAVSLPDAQAYGPAPPAADLV
jgi:hypothetical protein